MPTSFSKNILSKYCSSFGELALEKGVVDAVQLNEALAIQRAEEARGQEVRLLATIFFDQGWLTSEQVDALLTAVLRARRLDVVVPQQMRPVGTPCHE